MLAAMRRRPHRDAGDAGGEMKAACVLGAAAALLAVTTVRMAAQAQTVTGDPLPGITPTEFSDFRRGLEDFREIEEAEEGLGPLFNGTGCAVCHNVPAIGGGSPMTELRLRSEEHTSEL